MPETYPESESESESHTTRAREAPPTYPPRDGRLRPPRPQHGQRVMISRLMYRLNQIPEPNYIVAAAIGMSPITLSEYARGIKDIRANHLIQLCEFFQCQPEEIMGDMEVEIQ